MNTGEMDPIVVVAVIGFIQAVTLVLLSWLLARVGRVKKDAAETKEQIVNHHPKQPNYREQQDARHEETRKWFLTLFKKIGTVEKELHKRIDNVNETANELLTGFIENRERIESLEDTTSKGKKR